MKILSSLAEYHKKSVCLQGCLVYIEVNGSYFLCHKTDKQSDHIKMARSLITHCISVILIKNAHTLFCG